MTADLIFAQGLAEAAYKSYSGPFLDGYLDFLDRHFSDPAFGFVACYEDEDEEFSYNCGFAQAGEDCLDYFAAAPAVDVGNDPIPF